MCGEPAVDSQHARLESGSKQRLHESLAGLEILAANGYVAVFGQIEQHRRVGGEVGCAVGEWHTGLERRVSVDLAGRDFGIVLAQACLKSCERLVDSCGTVEDLRGPAPDHH